MASKDLKKWALSTAVTITSKAAAGGCNQRSLAKELEDLYDSLVKLQEKVDKND